MLSDGSASLEEQRVAMTAPIIAMSIYWVGEGGSGLGGGGVVESKENFNQVHALQFKYFQILPVFPNCFLVSLGLDRI